MNVNLESGAVLWTLARRIDVRCINSRVQVLVKGPD
jgi:hypothetical protein